MFPPQLLTSSHIELFKVSKMSQALGFQTFAQVFYCAFHQECLSNLLLHGPDHSFRWSISGGPSQFNSDITDFGKSSRISLIWISNISLTPMSVCLCMSITPPAHSSLSLCLPLSPSLVLPCAWAHEGMHAHTLFICKLVWFCTLQQKSELLASL